MKKLTKKSFLDVLAEMQERLLPDGKKMTIQPRFEIVPPPRFEGQELITPFGKIILSKEKDGKLYWQEVGHITFNAQESAAPWSKACQICSHGNRIINVCEHQPADPVI